MARKRRDFSAAFKAKVALAAARGDRTTAELAATHADVGSSEDGNGLWRTGNCHQTALLQRFLGGPFEGLRAGSRNDSNRQL